MHCTSHCESAIIATL